MILKITFLKKRTLTCPNVCLASDLCIVVTHWSISDYCMRRQVLVRNMWSIKRLFFCWIIFRIAKCLYQTTVMWQMTLNVPKQDINGPSQRSFIHKGMFNYRKYCLLKDLTFLYSFYILFYLNLPFSAEYVCTIVYKFWFCNCIWHYSYIVCADNNLSRIVMLQFIETHNIFRRECASTV